MKLEKASIFENREKNLLPAPFFPPPFLGLEQAKAIVESASSNAEVVGETVHDFAEVPVLQVARVN